MFFVVYVVSVGHQLSPIPAIPVFPVYVLKLTFLKTYPSSLRLFFARDVRGK